MMLALAFMPIDIATCLDKLQEKASDEVVAILDYFDFTYVVGRWAEDVIRGYSIPVWNQYAAMNIKLTTSARVVITLFSY